MPVEFDRIAMVFQPFIQPVTHGLHVLYIFFQIACRDFTGRPQPDDFEHIFGSGPHGHFLTGAVHEFCRLQSPSDVKGADAFGRVNFVPGNR